MKKKKLRYECYRCSERFVSWQKRNAHTEEAHKPPKKTEKRFKFEDERTLLNGRGSISLGSNVRIVLKGTVIKLTETEGSNELQVTLGIKENIWEHDK